MSTFSRRVRTDDGVVELETMFGALMVMVALSLMVSAGVYVNSSLAVSTAAHAATRAASLERTHHDAQSAAQKAAERSLKDRVACVSPVVATDTAQFVSGGVVTVEVSCVVPWVGMVDVNWVPPPTASAVAASPIEQWKASS